MHNLWTDIPLHPDVLREFGDTVEVIGPVSAPATVEPLYQLALADAALVRTVFPGSAQTFQQAPRLKVIARTGIGYDNIDLTAATAHGICVTNAPDAPTVSVAEFVFGLMLGVMRRIALADRAVRNADTGVSLIGADLDGKVLGLVGLGRIGTRVAEIARAFRMTVIAFDPFADGEHASSIGVELVMDLDTLLSRADVVSLHLPLTVETRGLIGARALRRMKRGSVLINTARGPLVDENALLEALQRGHLAGAGLDVWAHEPLDPRNPLLQLPQVVASPHIAGSTREGVSRSQRVALLAALSVLRGERPATLLNPDVWEQRR